MYVIKIVAIVAVSLPNYVFKSIDTTKKKLNICILDSDVRHTIVRSAVI